MVNRSLRILEIKFSWLNLNFRTGKRRRLTLDSLICEPPKQPPIQKKVSLSGDSIDCQEGQNTGTTPSSLSSSSSSSSSNTITSKGSNIKTQTVPETAPEPEEEQNELMVEKDFIQNSNRLSHISIGGDSKTGGSLRGSYIESEDDSDGGAENIDLLENRRPSDELSSSPRKGINLS